MPQLPKVPFLVASLFLVSISPAVAQTWTVESVDRENDDGSGRGFCLLKSSEGLVISVSGYENANYIGFTGRSAQSIGMPWLPHGPVVLTQTHVKVDDGYSATLDSTVHYVPKPESGGVLVDLYAYYPRIGQNLLGSMQQGSTLHIRVGEGFGVDNERNQSFSDPVSFSLAGSNAAISKAIECAIKAPTKGFDGEAFGAAIKAEIEAKTAVIYEECSFGKGIWISGTLNDARLFYMADDGETSRRNVYFERWINDKIVARMYGDLVLGAMSAGVSILKDYHPYDADSNAEPIKVDDRVTFAAVEFEDAAGRVAPKRVIFPDLGRVLAGKGSDYLDFYGEVKESDQVFAGEAEFDFFACRSDPVKLDPPPL